MSANTPDDHRTQLLDADLNRTQLITTAPGVNMTQTIQPVHCPVCKSANPPGVVYCVECGLVLSSALPEDAFGAPAIRPPSLCESSGREHFLRQGSNTVGREGDVLLTDTRVSRRHAEVVVSGSAVTVRDLGSTNGTFVDGEQIEGDATVPLGTGAKVSFGGVEMSLSSPGDSAATMMPSANRTQQMGAPPKVEQPPAFFVGATEEYPLRAGTNTLGRRPDSDVAISDPFISGAHALIDVENGEVYLTDIGSTNGTLLNGAKLPANQKTKLTESDEIALGELKFRIRLESE